MKDEEKYLSACWQSCTKIKIKLPSGSENNMESYNQADGSTESVDEIQEDIQSPVSQEVEAVNIKGDNNQQEDNHEVILELKELDEVDTNEPMEEAMEVNQPITVPDTSYTSVSAEDTSASDTSVLDSTTVNRYIKVPDESTPSKTMLTNLKESPVKFSQKTVLRPDGSPSLVLTSTPLHKKKESKEAWQPQTKLASVVAVVLGATKEVKELDTARKEFKSQQSNTYLKDKYLDVLALIQTRVSKTLTECLSEFSKWDKRFLLDSELKSPSAKEIWKNERASELMKKITYAKRLMKEWNIS